MPAGIFFVVIGGWLLSRWTYSSSAFGLVNGRYVFWLRLNVTSRKLIICLLASMVMRSPLLLKMRHISFLMFSVSLGEALVMASPSSRYSPTFMSRCWSCERRKLPTSSHVSAPSKLPIVTSNTVFPFFCQGCCLWIKMEFLAWVIMFLSSAVMFSWANGRIEFFYIKANEVRVLFSLSGVKPVDYRCSVFPLIKVAFTGDGIVDAIKDCFAYFAYLEFSWVD